MDVVSGDQAMLSKDELLKRRIGVEHHPVRDASRHVRYGVFVANPPAFSNAGCTGSQR